jgi:hypothetical protein
VHLTARGKNGATQSSWLTREAPNWQTACCGKFSNPKVPDDLRKLIEERQRQGWKRSTGFNI